MAEQIDILDERDPIGGPFFGSIVIHLSIVGVVFLYWYWIGRSHENIGDLNAGGGAYSVGITKSIPVPQREAPPNPVANDSQSMVRTAPAKQETQKKQIVPEKAIEIADRSKPKKQDVKPQQQQRYMAPAPQNQIYSQTKQALSNPMYGGPSGSGRVGVGPNTPLGDDRLGWYAEMIRQRLSQNWHTNGLNTGSAAIISFTIMRDGSIRDITVFQGSGNPSVDNSALRAVYDSNPLPALPPQVMGSTLPAQYTFQLR